MRILLILNVAIKYYLISIFTVECHREFVFLFVFLREEFIYSISGLLVSSNIQQFIGFAKRGIYVHHIGHGSQWRQFKLKDVFLLL